MKNEEIIKIINEGYKEKQYLRIELIIGVIHDGFQVLLVKSNFIIGITEQQRKSKLQLDCDIEQTLIFVKGILRVFNPSPIKNQ